MVATAGLSPPTRGSHHTHFHDLARGGSIPAHAGKPRNAASRNRLIGVYPRPRGEATSPTTSESADSGLSPPTRGSRNLQIPDLGILGSIPAHAGKPGARIRTASARRVYPRPRGEARTTRRLTSCAWGLSPPTRGSLQRNYFVAGIDRSIPAHAGKPDLALLRGGAQPVYPRPRGEAVSVSIWTVRDWGLSPPTRGSRHATHPDTGAVRSIPAHAGKPQPSTTATSPKAVYPRPRGEASRWVTGSPSPWGLSPPTRGSRDPTHNRPHRYRSIPAHAGKPWSKSSRLAWPAVYPRPRGEARQNTAVLLLAEGLSPPTRGSPNLGISRDTTSGSIPAHAGKPVLGCVASPAERVYPRPRGEAPMGSDTGQARYGLSPPTRGSLLPRLLEAPSPGSIPAHAGKPCRY